MSLVGNWKDVKDIAGHGAALEKKRSVPLHLAVAGPEGPMLDALATLVAPLTDRAVVDRVVVGPGGLSEAATSGAIADGVELVVVGCEGLPPGLGALFEDLRRRRIPFLTVRPSLASDLARPSDESLKQIGAGEVLDLDIGTEQAEDDLFGAMLGKMGEKKLALCANFAGARKHAAKDVINHTAWQNGAIAGVVIIPGADMPILTGNQIKMVLELAAIYGKQMTFARAKELIAVVGAGFTFRTLARELLGLVPGPGWTVKAAIGYAGTLAMGRAAEQYMIHGDEWAGAARKKLGEVRKRRGELARETPK